MMMCVALTVDVRCARSVSFHRRDKYRILKEQRAAQGKEAADEHEEELKVQAELFAKKIADMET